MVSQNRLSSTSPRCESISGRPMSFGIPGLLSQCGCVSRPYPSGVALILNSRRVLEGRPVKHRDQLLFLEAQMTLQLFGEPVDLAEHRLGIRVRVGHGRLQRSEEHTSELQSRGHLVCRLLLE